jgi:hypothetical protein
MFGEPGQPGAPAVVEDGRQALADFMPSAAPRWPGWQA